MRAYRTITLRAFVAVAAIAAPLFTAHTQTIAITGGKVYPVSGPPIENGTVIITNGKITAVGAASTVIPTGARRIDAAGKWVTPGLVDASTILGVLEVQFSGGYQDQSAKGAKGIAANFKVWEGLNGANTMIPMTRQDGITSVGVAPNGGYVSGQAAVIDLVQGSATQMLLKAPVAMTGDIGNPSAAEAGARGELIGKWRELLRDAKAYQLRKTQYEANQSRALSASRADLEALQPVLAGTLPLWLNADRASDIEAALALAKEFALKLVIVGGAEAWQVANELAAAKVTVMVGAMNNIPGSFSTLGARQENAALLRAAGVNVVLIGNGAGDPDSYNVRNIRYEAGNAVAYGMNWTEALRAITAAPAAALGVADKIGTLQAGREGNVVIWSGDPFEFATRAEHVFVRGAEYLEPTRQDQLTERYKNLPYKRP